jgi:hypothetical protein
LWNLLYEAFGFDIVTAFRQRISTVEFTLDDSREVIKAWHISATKDRDNLARIQDRRCACVDGQCATQVWSGMCASNVEAVCYGHL